MKITKNLGISFMLAVALLFVLNINIFAQEHKISEKEVPVIVMSTFHKAFPKAVIKGTNTETEKGKKYFEIESMEDTKHIDLLITAAGNIAEVEESIPTDQIPGRVMKTLEKEFKRLKIETAEKVTHGTVSNYEFVVESNSGKYEVKLNAAGKLLKSEKASKESDKAD